MTKFKVGDIVRAKEAYGSLSANIPYEVEKVIKSEASDDNLLILKTIVTPYFEFRFELIRRSGDGPASVDAVPITMAVTNVPINMINWADEGITSVPISGASKHDSDKIDLSLIPYVALREEAKAFMVGAKKYGRLNYLKGHKNSQLVAAAMRHLLAWNEGEEIDPTDGQHHLGSVRACVGMILRQIEVGTFIDDRKNNDKV